MAELSYTLLRLLPKTTLSRAVGAACRASAPRPMVRAAIRAFARKYGVDASEAERPLEEYPTFTEFFTRRLKPGARRIAPGDRLPVSPVDGTVGELGDIVDSRLYQAKGKHYTLAELIGGPNAEEDARKFAGGAFCTIYRAPHDDVATTARRTRQPVRKIYPRPIPVEKGGELAVFEMGSTVVVLFAAGVKLASHLRPGLPIRLGEPLESP